MNLYSDVQGDPHYWQKNHGPMHVCLLRVVRESWANNPPIKNLQLQFLPHWAGKHCLESVVISRLANEAGGHAIAVGLLRHSVEALSVVAMGISSWSQKVKTLEKWEKEKLSQGALRRSLEQDVWPTTGLRGLWGESWSQFWRNLCKAVQPYAHFSPPLMRWHQRAEMKGDKFLFWVNHPEGDFEQYRADRIATFQLLVLWAFGELVNAFQAAPEPELESLIKLVNAIRLQLSVAPVFFHGENWEVQLLPFVFPRDHK